VQPWPLGEVEAVDLAVVKEVERVAVGMVVAGLAVVKVEGATVVASVVEMAVVEMVVEKAEVGMEEVTVEAAKEEAAMVEVVMVEAATAAAMVEAAMVAEMVAVATVAVRVAPRSLRPRNSVRRAGSLPSRTRIPQYCRHTQRREKTLRRRARTLPMPKQAKRRDHTRYWHPLQARFACTAVRRIRRTWNGPATMWRCAGNRPFLQTS
jgi:hypothetical protein